MSAPANLVIIRADGTVDPVEVEFIGTEPMQLADEIRIVNRYRVTTDTHMVEGDRLDGDIPDDCSVILKHAGYR